MDLGPPASWDGRPIRRHALICNLAISVRGSIGRLRMGETRPSHAASLANIRASLLTVRFLPISTDAARRQGTRPEDRLVGVVEDVRARATLQGMTTREMAEQGLGAARGPGAGCAGGAGPARCGRSHCGTSPWRTRRSQPRRRRRSKARDELVTVVRPSSPRRDQTRVRLG